MPDKVRRLPNIMITGTPGVGKSTFCKKLAEKSEYNWIQVSAVVKEHKCYDGNDKEFDCPFLDEDKLLDLMEDMMAPGGQIVDYHSCDFFPERWFDAVYVLRADNTVLYDRLTARGYSGKKLDNNISCEIFGTIADEAKSSYKEDIVFELTNNTEEDSDKNIAQILQWIQNWKSGDS